MEEFDGRDWQGFECLQWKGAMDVQEMFFFLWKIWKKALVGAMVDVEPESFSAPKRPRVHPPAQFQACSSSSASPDVAVSNHCYYSPKLNWSIYLQVHVSYKPPKAYLLTPQRKRLGKAVARRSSKTVAKECLKNECSRNHTLNILCSSIYKEVKSIASTKVQSTLLYQSKQSITDFDWKQVEREMATRCPLLLKILTAATRTRSERANRTTTIVMCLAMIVKHRNPNVNLLQKIISLILYAGHCSKQVCFSSYSCIAIKWLNYIGVSAFTAIEYYNVLLLSTSAAGQDRGKPWC